MPYLLLTLAALFWGGNYVVGHVLVQGVDPILMTEARWALTALLLGLLYRQQIAGSRHLPGKRASGGGANPPRPGQFPLTPILACKPPPRSTPPSIYPPRRAWYC